MCSSWSGRSRRRRSCTRLVGCGGRGVRGLACVRDSFLAPESHCRRRDRREVRRRGGPGRVVAGRAANPSAVDEITIGEGLAAKLHLGVGGHLDAVSYSVAQASALSRRTPIRDPSRSAAAASDRRDCAPTVGPRQSRRGGWRPRGLRLSAGLREPDRNLGTVFRVRTRDGAADVPGWWHRRGGSLPTQRFSGDVGRD